MRERFGGNVSQRSDGALHVDQPTPAGIPRLVEVVMHGMATAGGGRAT